MALARTKMRLKPAGRTGQSDPALSRLMEARSTAQQAPVARAPMRFGPERFAAPPEPEPDFAVPSSRSSAKPPATVAAKTDAPPATVAAKTSAPLASTAPPQTAPAPPPAEPEEEMVTVERRGARPPASFVLTGQRSFGPRTPIHQEFGDWEPVVLTSLVVPALKLDETEAGSLKLNGEQVPGSVDQLRSVAGDLMTILVVRATPSLLPGLMELPRGPQVEPNDWKAFRDWVRQRIREQDGPDPAGLVEFPEIELVPTSGSFVQALFGADHFWPNPKTYIVYPTRELVRRPLLQHADLPEGEDTVPLLVSRQYEAVHRRIIAEWSPVEVESPTPSAGTFPAAAAPRASAPEPQNATTQAASVQAPSVVPQTRLAAGPPLDSMPGMPAEAPSHIAKPHAPTLPSLTHQVQVGERVTSSDTNHSGQNFGVSQQVQLPSASDGYLSGYSGGSTGSFSSGIVLPRFGVMTAALESRPLVVLHRQPPVARMVTLDLEPADRIAGPAPAPPMVAADTQPEIRHTPSGRPSGRLDVSLRLQTMVGLTGNERDSNSPLRGDAESMTWNWLALPAPSIPVVNTRLRPARVPVQRTAVWLAGADRATEFFLSPSPVEFTATVDQWSAL